MALFTLFCSQNISDDSRCGICNQSDTRECQPYLLARETAGTSRATAAAAIRPGSRAGHFITESRDRQFNSYRAAKGEGRYDPAVANADYHDPWTSKMHVMMDGTTLSADAPDWFHVPHTTVCNMTKKQVDSLMEYKAPVPTHLVPPALLSAYKSLKPPPTPGSPAQSRPSTTASVVRGNLAGGGGHYTQQQLAQKMSRWGLTYTSSFGVFLTRSI